MVFEGDDWLVQIYKDKHRSICIIKCVQCGISEWAIIVTLTECINGRSVLYVLPSKSFKTDFIAKRIDGLFEKVPFYSAGVGKTDNKGIKSLWSGYMKIVGSNIKVDLQSDPAQVAIVDELDECHQNNLELVDGRTDAAFKLTGIEPRRIDISNPTIEGCGIDGKYEESDQREWKITCKFCKLEQPLDWFVNFVYQDDKNKYHLIDKDWHEELDRDIRGYCADCRNEIDRLSKGQWIAKYPERVTHGYHISQLFTGQKTIRQIYAKFLKGLKDVIALQVFYNSILGLPFTNAGFKITPKLLASCVEKGYTMPESAIASVAGVDIGKDVHIQISTLKDKKRYKAYVNHIPLTDEFEAELFFVLKSYGVKVCVIDAMPETGLVRKFQKYARKRGIRVFLCRFQSGISIKEMKPDKKTGEINPDRTQAFDACFDSYRSNEVILPDNWRDIGHSIYKIQMCHNIRRLVEDDKGNKHYTWTAGKKKADHYHLADIYELFAARVCRFDLSPQEITWL